MMRPRFPNSAIVRAPERAVLRGGRWRGLDIPVRYGVFRHPDHGEVLVDTGYTPRVTCGRRSLPLRIYSLLIRPKLTPPQPAHNPHTILLTHLHADHISGLRDHPDARIIASREAIQHFEQKGWFGRVRHGVFWELMPDAYAARMTYLDDLPLVDAPLGLGYGHDVFGDGSVISVDLPGHAPGHVGYLWTGGDTPLLYAADAQWHARAVMEDRSPGPPAKWIMHDPKAAIDTGKRIATFARAGGHVIYCHDPEVPDL